MATLKAHHAYLLGFTPQLLGIFFNGLLLLERVRRAADGALAERVDGYLGDWIPSRSSDVVSNVHLVESMLSAVGKNAGAPPQTIEEFYEWSQRVNKATYDAAKAAFENAIELDAAARFRVRLGQDLGQQMGDIVQLANLGALVQELLEVGPDDPLLNQQSGRFGEAQRSITQQLENVLNYTAGHDDIQAQVRRVLALLTAAPDAGAKEGHVVAALGLAALAGQLDLAAVEKLFMA
jgi:hypothetical protein